MSQTAEAQLDELEDGNLGGFWGFWAGNGTLIAVAISTIIQVMYCWFYKKLVSEKIITYCTIRFCISIDWNNVVLLKVLFTGFSVIDP